MQTALIVSTNRKEKTFIKTAWQSALAVLFLCLAMLGRPAAAQSGQQFVGHVEDTSHAVIAGARSFTFGTQKPKGALWEP